ncbi:MAG: hypothetical protein HQK57_02320 [Deltaproteobacteria bacterium]|nr:hypothetical protein [Deltaproteobacteria bacterium]
MKEIKRLESTFKDCLGWQAQRISFLTQFLIAVIKARTVNLAEISDWTLDKISMAFLLFISRRLVLQEAQGV